MAKLNMKTTKKWHKSLINLAEKTLQRITKLPIKISAEKESILLNASAIFWYQDQDCKKFIMLKSTFAGEETVVQFPFAACFTKDSVSMTLENSVKDLFGKAFKKTLPLDCFAADKVASVPTVIVAEEDNNHQTILHNMVWVNQITEEQAMLIQDNAKEFDVVCMPEYQLTDPQIHEVHKFIYQSCLRHIHAKSFSDMMQLGDMMEDMPQNNSNKVLH